MDHAITLVTPAMNRQRGADAFDQGLGIDDHNMNPWVAAAADWRKGWQERKAQVEAERVLAAAMAMRCPP
jgi:hypothetical protein